MASGETIDDVIRRIINILDSASVPYMLTGSFASSLHGMPRATQDIDLVIAPNPASLEALLKSFPEDRYYVSREAAFDAYQRASIFNVIDFASGWKIDFIVRKPRDFSRLEFDRRTQANVLGTTVFVASPEDVLISKLEWAKLAASERQIEDAAGIIRTQGPDLDTAYIDHWAEKLGLQAHWAMAKAKAS
jgi:hypothetical protein